MRSLFSSFLFLLALTVLPAARSDAPRTTLPIVAEGVAERWEALRKDGTAAKPADVQVLLSADADKPGLVAVEDRYQALWSALDRWLGGQAELVETLRKEQDKLARPDVLAARRSSDAAKVLALYRRYPWAASVHEGLLELGEQALRRGAFGSAARCFDDVRRHSADAALKAKATVGLWVALAQSPHDPEALAAAWHGVADDALYPWMGKPTTAREIRKRLTTDPIDAVTSPSLADLETRILEAPDDRRPWIIDEPIYWSQLKEEQRAALSPRPSIVAFRGGVLQAGPQLLRCYGDGLAHPRWQHTSTVPLGSGPRLEIAPGPFVPAVADGRVYTRWGIRTERLSRTTSDTAQRGLKDVAAFALRDGSLLWTTAADPAWEEFWPASDPVAAEGRLYLLVVKTAVGDDPQPLALACLEAATGAVAWVRELGAAPRLIGATVVQRTRVPVTALDLTRFGNAVTVAHGAVYCQTNGGLLARCDARDGLLEWARLYPRATADDKLLMLALRQGSAPVVAGKRVLFLPRDARRLMAVKTDSGELDWELNDKGYRQVVGLADGALVLAEERVLEGVDVATGKPAWEKRFDEPVEGRTTLTGGTLYVGTNGKCYRLDARKGEVVEERAWGKSGPLAVWDLGDKAFVGLGEEDEPRDDGRSGVKKQKSKTPRGPNDKKTPARSPTEIHGTFLGAGEATVTLRGVRLPDTTFALAKDAKVVVDGKAGNSADVPKGASVRWQLSEDGKQIVRLTAEGARITGTIESIDPSGKSLVLRTREGKDGTRSYPLAPGAAAAWQGEEGRTGARVEFDVIEPGQPVALTQSVDKQTVVAVALVWSQPDVRGRVVGVDTGTNTVLLEVRRDEKLEKEKPYALAAGARVLIDDGREGKLSDLAAGCEADVKFGDDGKRTIALMWAEGAHFGWATLHAVDAEKRTITIGNSREGLKAFDVTRETLIALPREGDRPGQTIALGDLKPGQIISLKTAVDGKRALSLIVRQR